MPSYKIALVTTFPPGKGSLNEYAYHFVRYLRQKREVKELVLLVDALPGNEQYPEFENDGYAPTRIIPCWDFDSKTNALRILKVVRQEKPDIVMLNLQFASFGSGKVAAALGLTTPALIRLAGFPVVTLLHNIMETIDLKKAGFGGNPLLEHAIRAFGYIFTRLLLLSNLVAVTIPKYVEILEIKYKAKNVLLTPHGSFEAGADPVFEPPPGPQRIMTFGKFGTYKKVEPLVEAYKILQARNHPNMELVIAGTDSPNSPGYLDSVKQTYSEVKSISFTGYVAEEDVPKVFGEASVVVFPYNSTTGSSGVLHQAGEYARAVVLPNIGDFAALVAEEGFTGEFFEPDNTESLAHAIANILDNPKRRLEIASQNFAAATGLPVSDVVDWYLLHMQTLVSKKPKAKR
jgi:glycosyltransferase involved in cell wall biosynthesis